VTNPTAYERLEQRYAHIRVLEDVTGILSWDAQAMMPLGAADGRAEQLAALSGLAHKALTAPEVADLLNATEAERAGLDAWRDANLREMRPARCAPRL
jgi:carboxypeptidase Taq